ncbi:MAG: hypothetical protein ABJA67_12300, partial [Chthonomonadales bacterium]
IIVLAGLTYCWTSGILRAQIQQLTTDSTGSVLYFSSRLVLPDTTLKYCCQSKIFKWDSTSGVRTFLEREYVNGPISGRFQTSVSNFFTLESPSVSSDGRVIAVVGHQACNGCVTGFTQQASSEITFLQPDRTESDHWVNADPDSTLKVGLSRNGRIIYRRIDQQGLFAGAFDAGSKMILSGALSFSSVPYAATGTRQMVADNGTSVFADKNSVLVLAKGIRSQDQTSLQSAGQVLAPVVNASAKTIVYETLYAGEEPGALYAYDIGSGRKTLLFYDPSVRRVPFPLDRLSNIVPSLTSPPYLPLEIPSYNASIDDNGSNVLAMVREAAGLPRQWLFLIKSDGSDPYWFGYAPEGYREAIISGDGKVVFAVTEWSQLLRFDLNTGECAELVPRTPWVQGVYGSGWPGAANHIIGGGFTTETYTPDSYPASTEWGDVWVEYLGQRMPLLKVSPTEIIYQIPWEFPKKLPVDVLDLDLHVHAPSNSPFTIDRAQLGHSYPAPPRIERPGPIHEDGSSVALDNPVRAGEVLRLYATGFDNPKGTTGQIELGPPSASNNDLNCNMSDPFNPIPASAVDLLYFGLAPAKAGVYEIRIRVPDDFKTNSYRGNIDCRNTRADPLSVSVPFLPN